MLDCVHPVAAAFMLLDRRIDDRGISTDLVPTLLNMYDALYAKLTASDLNPKNQDCQQSLLDHQIIPAPGNKFNNDARGRKSGIVIFKNNRINSIISESGDSDYCPRLQDSFVNSESGCPNFYQIPQDSRNNGHSLFFQKYQVPCSESRMCSPESRICEDSSKSDSEKEYDSPEYADIGYFDDSSYSLSCSLSSDLAPLSPGGSSQICGHITNRLSQVSTGNQHRKFISLSRGNSDVSRSHRGCQRFPRCRPSSVISSSSSSSSNSFPREGALARFNTFLASVESLEDTVIHEEAPANGDSTRRRDPDLKSRREIALKSGSGDSGVQCSIISGPQPPFNRPQYCDPNLDYLDKVVLEIIDTEQAYVRDLNDIIQGYLEYWRAHPETEIYDDQLENLFSNIEQIYHFNKVFLRELEECGTDPVAVAKCFVQNNSGFAIYTQYCTNYPRTVSLLTSLMRNESAVRACRDRQLFLGHAMPLGSYLLKPVQRILKYHLLLGNIVKNLNEDEAGYSDVLKALSAMTGIAHHINEMKKRHEDAVRVQEVQSLLYGWPGEDLTTYGELSAEGNFKMFGHKGLRQLFLFDKMLLLTKRKDQNALAYKAHIMCSDLMLIESIKGEPLNFHVIPFSNPKCQYTLGCRNLEQKREWTLELKRVILENFTASIPDHARQLVMELGKFKQEDVPSNDWRGRVKSHQAPEYLEKRKDRRRASECGGVQSRLKMRRNSRKGKDDFGGLFGVRSRSSSRCRGVDTDDENDRKSSLGNALSAVAEKSRLRLPLWRRTSEPMPFNRSYSEPCRDNHQNASNFDENASKFAEIATKFDENSIKFAEITTKFDEIAESFDNSSNFDEKREVVTDFDNELEVFDENDKNSVENLNKSTEIESHSPIFAQSEKTAHENLEQIVSRLLEHQLQMQKIILNKQRSAHFRRKKCKFFENRPNFQNFGSDKNFENDKNLENGDNNLDNNNINDNYLSNNNINDNDLDNNSINSNNNNSITLLRENLNRHSESNILNRLSKEGNLNKIPEYDISSRLLENNDENKLLECNNSNENMFSLSNKNPSVKVTYSEIDENPKIFEKSKSENSKSHEESKNHQTKLDVEYRRCKSINCPNTTNFSSDFSGEVRGAARESVVIGCFGSTGFYNPKKYDEKVNENITNIEFYDPNHMTTRDCSPSHISPVSSPTYNSCYSLSSKPSIHRMNSYSSSSSGSSVSTKNSLERSRNNLESLRESFRLRRSLKSRKSLDKMANSQPESCPENQKSPASTSDLEIEDGVHPEHKIYSKIAANKRILRKVLSKITPRKSSFSNMSDFLSSSTPSDLDSYKKTGAAVSSVARQYSRSLRERIRQIRTDDSQNKLNLYGTNSSVGARLAGQHSVPNCTAGIRLAGKHVDNCGAGTPLTAQNPVDNFVLFPAKKSSLCTFENSENKCSSHSNNINFRKLSIYENGDASSTSENNSKNVLNNTPEDQIDQNSSKNIIPQIFQNCTKNISKIHVEDLTQLLNVDGDTSQFLDPCDQHQFSNLSADYYEKSFEAMESMLDSEVFRDSAIYSDQEGAIYSDHEDVLEKNESSRVINSNSAINNDNRKITSNSKLNSDNKRVNNSTNAISNDNTRTSNINSEIILDNKRVINDISAINNDNNRVNNSNSEINGGNKRIISDNSAVNDRNRVNNSKSYANLDNKRVINSTSAVNDRNRVNNSKSEANLDNKRGINGTSVFNDNRVIYSNDNMVMNNNNVANKNCKKDRKNYEFLFDENKNNKILSERLKLSNVKHRQKIFNSCEMLTPVNDPNLPLNGENPPNNGENLPVNGENLSSTEISKSNSVLVLETCRNLSPETNSDKVSKFLEKTSFTKFVETTSVNSKNTTKKISQNFNFRSSQKIKKLNFKNSVKDSINFENSLNIKHRHSVNLENSNINFKNSVNSIKNLVNSAENLLNLDEAVSYSAKNSLISTEISLNSDENSTNSSENLLNSDKYLLNSVKNLENSLNSDEKSTNKSENSINSSENAENLIKNSLNSYKNSANTIENLINSEKNLLNSGKKTENSLNIDTKILDSKEFDTLTGTPKGWVKSLVEKLQELES